MITQALAVAGMLALLAVTPASASVGQDTTSAGAGVAALGLTAVLLGHGRPLAVYPAPSVLYPSPPREASAPVAGDRAATHDTR